MRIPLQLVRLTPRLRAPHLFPALLATLLATAAMAPAVQPVRAQTGPRLTFVITGLRTDTGAVRGGIYASPDVWTDVGGEVAVCASPVSGGVSRCTITAPGPGRYAFAFYHDADADDQLDRDLFGIPQEGYGFSNNARPGMGAPSFDSAAFEVGSTPYTGRIAALYGWSP